jgi:maleylacetoacetate isomerase
LDFENREELHRRNFTAWKFRKNWKFKGSIMSVPRLYTYFRSGAAQRVRIGLELKGVAYESVPVHLVRNGGEHLLPAFKAINPQARVPVLELRDGTTLAQSPAILEYLEETIPQPPFLPFGPVARAKVRRVAAIIGCDIHPLNNVGPLNELRQSGWSDVQVAAWISKWITLGLETVEQLIGDEKWCFGNEPGLADIYLAPQLYSARRFKVPFDHLRRITRVANLTDEHPAFRAAAPENQPDAE